MEKNEKKYSMSLERKILDKSAIELIGSMYRVNQYPFYQNQILIVLAPLSSSRQQKLLSLIPFQYFLLSLWNEALGASIRFVP